MWKKILLISGCVINFWNVNAMIESEQMIDNPIPKIVQKYNEISPQKVIEDFKKSVGDCIKNVDKVRSTISTNDTLSQKWNHGIELLKQVTSLNKSTELSKLESTLKSVKEITHNGFYDVSNVIITLNQAMEPAKIVLEQLWQNLKQSEEILNWLICCSSEKINKNELSDLSLWASKLFFESEETSSIFWAISIMMDSEEAIAELSDDGNPDEDTVVNAKKHAENYIEKALGQEFAKSLHLQGS